MPESSSESTPHPEDTPESHLASKVRALALTEAKILFYKCRGKKYRQLRQLLYVTQDDVEAATARLYVKLGVDLGLHSRVRDGMLRATFCPILEALLLGLPGKDEAKFAHWPPKAPSLIIETTPASLPAPEAGLTGGALVPYNYNRALQVVKAEMEEEEQGGGEDEEVSNVRLLPGSSNLIVPDDKRQRSGRIIIAWWLLSLCLVAGVSAGIVYFLSSRSSASPGRETQIVVTATPLPATETVMPSQTAAVVTDSPTAEPSPVATQTARVITATPEPLTPTPVSSATPRPTDTPSFQLPFTDSFDQGIRPEWLTSGILLTDGGVLAKAGNDNATLTIGDATLDNYEVSLDVRGNDSNDNYEIFLIFGSNLRLQVTRYDFQWYVKDGDFWTEAGGDFFNPHTAGRVIVQVQGPNVAVILGANRETFGFGQSLAGPLTLVNSHSRTRLDNFSLTALP